MNLYVIGDIHGCYYTYLKLLDYWKKEEEILIQIGDLIDRGNFSPEAVRLSKQLQNEYKDRAVFLKGNHEYEAILHISNGPNDNWLRQCGLQTLNQYENHDFNRDVEWFSTLPLYWENEHVFISHAGIAEKAENPFDEESPFGVLWNRSPLKNIGKLQIIGHTPCKTPSFNPDTSSWNIDTGGTFFGKITGIKLTDQGEILEIISLKTSQKDFEF